MSPVLCMGRNSPAIILGGVLVTDVLDAFCSGFTGREENTFLRHLRVGTISPSPRKQRVKCQWSCLTANVSGHRNKRAVF